MTRRSRPWLPAALCALGVACGDTTTLGIPQLNLDRPVDVSFACYGQMRQTNGRPGPSMASDPTITTAMPAFACQQLSPPLSTDPITPADGQTDVNGKPLAPDWYAFILQSASGTVALATWPSGPADTMASSASPLRVSDSIGSVFRVLDGDPLTPGKNAISIGEDPVAIATDKAGCYEVTANAGSCDLSELDINKTLAGLDIDGAPLTSGSKPKVDRVQVKTRNGTPILARPGVMIAEPGTQVVGNACAATATGQLYITYPSCHLVAEVLLGADATGGASATLIGGIQYDASGAPKVLVDADLEAVGMSCPTECAPAKGVAPVPVQPGVRPVALDYKLDPRVDLSKAAPTSRLAIGADVSSAGTAVAQTAVPLFIVDLDLTTFAPVAAKLQPIALEADGDPVGVTALAISPQIGMGGNAKERSVSEDTPDQAQFIYAIATDGTVRVAEVFTKNRECDTQIDSRFLRRLNSTSLDCLQPGQPGVPRRSGARSPGIELPGAAVPNSVAIVKGLTAPPVTGKDAVGNPIIGDPGPPVLLGYFAIITASTGVVYVANIDDDYAPDQTNGASGSAFATSPVLVIPHQLRDGLSLREDLPKDCKAVDGPAGANAGGPRLGAPPAQQFVPNTLSTDLDTQLPRPQQVACTIDGSNTPVSALEFGAPETSDSSLGPATSRDLAYPDLRSVVAENWTLTYEGTLGNDTTLNAPNGPTIRSGQAFVTRDGMVLEDAARPFCGMGIEPGDIVELRGCNPANGDGDCPADYTCYVHPRSTIGVGACLLRSEAPRLADACQDFLTTSRRYTVGTDASGRTTAGKLILLQRKRELSTTPIDGCVSDDQCNDLAKAAAILNHSADSTSNAQWSCQADPLRPPINPGNLAQNKRCVQICTPPKNPSDALQPPLCGVGAVCAADPSNAAGGVCLEGVEPPQVCLNGPQRYSVRAGEAFAVVGDRSGFVHPIITDADGSCKVDPGLAKNPLQRGRIPLKAPACDPTADRFTGVIPATGAFEPNPCSLTVPQYELAPAYVGPAGGSVFGACTVTGEAPVLTTHPAVPAIKFRNRSMTLTLVDPYRPAAQSCLMHDPAGVPTNVPLVVPGYQIGLDVKAGYAPFTLSLVGQVSPVKVVRGPTDSIWVIDDGDFLATNITEASTRGKVFRIESVNTFFVNTME